MAQTPASRGVQTQKLDEILRKLSAQPSVDDWHEMATVLTQVSDKMERINTTVIKLDLAINGNGKPGIKAQVHDLEKDVAGYNKLAWIIIGAGVTSVIGIFVYLAQTM